MKRYRPRISRRSLLKAAENAVVKCKDGAQVVLCGGGVLNISAAGKNGIKSGTTAA